MKLASIGAGAALKNYGYLLFSESILILADYSKEREFHVSSHSYTVNRWYNIYHIV